MGSGATPLPPAGACGQVYSAARRARGTWPMRCQARAAAVFACPDLPGAVGNASVWGSVVCAVSRRRLQMAQAQVNAGSHHDDKRLND